MFRVLMLSGVVLKVWMFGIGGGVLGDVVMVRMCVCV